MTNKDKQIQVINEIRDLMEKSTRFLSLSGLSGISMGIIALLSAAMAFFYLDYDDRYFKVSHYFNDGLYELVQIKIKGLILLAFLTLILAIGLAIFFTASKAKKQNMPLWSSVTKRLLINLSLPLVSGGIFCLILIYHHIYYLIAPATLVFYGLALFNASKYTLHDIRYLAISEIVLGLLASLFIGYGLIFWAVGFGVLHILYGSIMYFKYR